MSSRPRHSVQDLPHHRRRLTIDHQPLAEVTPETLLWWFRHLGGGMDYGASRCRITSSGTPRPHPLGACTTGTGWGRGEDARFRIVEAFQRGPEFCVDSTETVEKLDEAGVRLVRRVAGVPIFQLEHTWSQGTSGTHYVGVMDLGARSRTFTGQPVLTQRAFPDAMARAWLRHNVEEVGLLEHLLPPPLAQQR